MHRSKAIDILRFLAVFLVMVRHMAPCPADAPPLLKSICDFVSAGGIGVTLSFVLSGFLIAGLLFREQQNTGDISFSRFFIRRGLRIYPAFWVLLLVTLGVAAVRDHPINPSATLSELLFLQNYGPSIFGHTWSLAVEEHFYLLLVTLLLLLSRRPSAQPFAAVPLIVLGIAVATFGLRCAMSLWTQFAPDTHLFPTHLRLDALFFGVFLAYQHHYHREAFDRWTARFRRPLLIGGIALMMLPLVFRGESTPFIYTIGMTLVYLGCGFLLLAMLASRLPQHPAISLFAALGTFSYAIYLWHLSVARWGTYLVARIFQEHWNWYWHTAVYFAGSIVVGIVMTKLVEYPALRFRDHCFPSLARSRKPEAPRPSPARALAMSPTT